MRRDASEGVMGAGGSRATLSVGVARAFYSSIECDFDDTDATKMERLEWILSTNSEQVKNELEN